MNKWWLIILTILLAAGVSVASFKIMERNFNPVPIKDGNGKIHFVAESSKAASSAELYPDLTEAAATASQQVVHIKVQIGQQPGNA